MHELTHLVFVSNTILCKCSKCILLRRPNFLSKNKYNEKYLPNFLKIIIVI